MTLIGLVVLAWLKSSVKFSSSPFFMSSMYRFNKLDFKAPGRVMIAVLSCHSMSDCSQGSPPCGITVNNNNNRNTYIALPSVLGRIPGVLYIKAEIKCNQAWQASIKQVERQDKQADRLKTQLKLFNREGRPCRPS